MYDRETFEARRDRAARMTRTSSSHDPVARYLGVAGYGGGTRPQPPPQPPAPPGVPPPDQPDPSASTTERRTAREADQVIDRVLADTETRPRAPDKGRRGWRKRWWSPYSGSTD
ncbi:MAG: hypothetical protein HKP61_19795 [Dactylosporangium sp.]|nr:hypothetical protein [Dactylosporangium sp.]NNJ63129.1 hypothetical protein [Dactylosporangium sp.]